MIQYLFQPVISNDLLTHIDITQKMIDLDYAANQIFSKMQEKIYGCLTSYYNSDEIKCYDEAGTLELITDEKNNYKEYYFTRATKGVITLHYTAKIFEIFNWPNPAYSLHHRSQGVTGFASTFLLIPEGSNDYEFVYSSFKGICANSYGINHVEHILTAKELETTCFAFNSPYCYHEENSQLYILYFEDDLRFFDEIKTKLTMYYNYMQQLFLGKDEPYMIFMYRKEAKYKISLTGTAEKNICLMGYGDELVNCYQDIEGTLVHEIVHNFIQLNDIPAYHSLFDEGTADYYSAMIPYYLKINTIDQTVSRINQMIQLYYSNPWKEKELIEAYEHGWTHSYAQRISYGKGIIFILGLDTLLKKYHSSHTLIDHIIKMISQQNHSYTLKDLVHEIDLETNGEASSYLDLIIHEGKIPLLDGLFENYQVVETTIPIEENGFDDQVAYSNPKRVLNIQKDSNAYRAGLRDGDIILDKISEWRYAENSSMLAEYNIQRGNETLKISYLPRGQDTYCYQYKKIV